MKYPIGFTLLLAGSLVSCGGGSGNSAGSVQLQTPQTQNPAPTVPTNASTPTLTQGMVTGFGSVIVNGIHYDVGDAAIEVDGEAQSEADLAVGQFVTIDGTLSPDGIHGKAKKLKSDSRLVGPVDSIDLTTGVIVALGVSVVITADTFFEDGLTAEKLKVGDNIRVCSFTDTDGTLVATRVDLKKNPTANKVQLTGKVSELDTTAQTFVLNGKKVDYSKATLNDLPTKTLANDLVVRVHGAVVNDVLVAAGNVHLSAMDIKHHEKSEKSMHVEAGGLVSNVIPGTSFTLGEAKILLAADTKIEGGVLGDLAEGIMAKVRGTMDADKNLVAASIKLILKVKVEDQGLVQAIDLEKNTFTLNGVIFEMGVDTSVNDESKMKLRFFNIKDLMVGDFVNVRGYRKIADGGAMVAVRVERHNAPAQGLAEGRAVVEGKVDSVVDGTISIHARSIKIPDSIIIKGYASVQDFLAAAVGLQLEVKGVMEAGVFVAKRIEVVSEGDSASGDHQGPPNGHGPRDRRLPGVDHDKGDHQLGAEQEDGDHEDGDQEAPSSDAGQDAGVDPEFSVPPVPALL